MKLDFIRFRN